MTRYVATTELKAKLSEVLGDVERGEHIEITRHGKAIARIEPIKQSSNEEIRRSIEEMRKLRGQLPKTGITVDDILAWRHEGHKY